MTRNVCSRLLAMLFMTTALFAMVPAMSAESPKQMVERLGGSAVTILDVLVEGVSMAISQRSEFGAIIAKNGGDVEALLVRLRPQNGK